jgi:hypothetical protein
MTTLDDRPTSEIKAKPALALIAPPELNPTSTDRPDAIPVKTYDSAPPNVPPRTYNRVWLDAALYLVLAFGP